MAAWALPDALDGRRGAADARLLVASPPSSSQHLLSASPPGSSQRLAASPPRSGQHRLATSPPGSSQHLLLAASPPGSGQRLATSPLGSGQKLLAAGPPGSSDFMSEAMAESLYAGLLARGKELQAARQSSPLRSIGHAASPCGGRPPSKEGSLLAPRSPVGAASPLRASCFRAAADAKSPLGPDARRHGANREGEDQENAYLRRNIEHLRLGKRQLEAQVANLNMRVESLQEQNRQYRAFCEQPRAGAGDSGGRLGMEMDNLQQKLTAVQMLKDALNTENLELQSRLDAAQENLRTEQKEQRHTQCVVCLDNLANVVCLPCKHLALCSLCGAPERNIESCPICRTSLSDRLQVFMP